MAAFLVDNLLMNIQFSYACDYYSERYKIYAGEDIFLKDEFAIENICFPSTSTSLRSSRSAAICLRSQLIAASNPIFII